jgi:hypothetical protein
MLVFLTFLLYNILYLFAAEKSRVRHIFRVPVSEIGHGSYRTRQVGPNNIHASKSFGSGSTWPPVDLVLRDQNREPETMKLAKNKFFCFFSHFAPNAFKFFYVLTTYS